jgi:uncharacterized OB-fold protein
VVNCAPESVRIGMQVALTWNSRYGAPYPVFEPALDGLR